MIDSLEKTLIASAVILAGTLAASAQVIPPNPPSTQAVPEQQPSPPTPRRQQKPQEGQESNLSRSQGVLTPPRTGDPVVKTPDRSVAPSTPVIPPPGTPGGRQDIEPK